MSCACWDLQHVKETVYLRNPTCLAIIFTYWPNSKILSQLLLISHKQDKFLLVCLVLPSSSIVLSSSTMRSSFISHWGHLHSAVRGGFVSSESICLALLVAILAAMLLLQLSRSGCGVSCLTCFKAGCTVITP